jgi:hypothetical protein
MKSWNELDDATPPVKRRRIQGRWRALSATFVTLVCLAAVDTIFPNLKNWDPSSLKEEPAPQFTPFEWSEVRRECFLSVVPRTWFCYYCILSDRMRLSIRVAQQMNTPSAGDAKHPCVTTWAQSQHVILLAV